MKMKLNFEFIGGWEYAGACWLDKKLLITFVRHTNIDNVKAFHLIAIGLRWPPVRQLTTMANTDQWKRELEDIK